MFFDLVLSLDSDKMTAFWPNGSLILNFLAYSKTAYQMKNFYKRSFFDSILSLQSDEMELQQ